MIIEYYGGMNQDQVKEALLSITGAPMEFSVIFSGKKSSKVNGLYKAGTREIILHNRNFSGDSGGINLLLYTAIHEYAHHLHACSRGGTLSSRAHTAEFWAIFHELLERAEKKQVYRNVFLDSPELSKLTVLIKEKFLEKNGTLVKELGKYLLQAYELCDKINGRFEDYVDRVLRIPKLAAQTAMKMYQYDLDPRVGADNMRYLTGIRNEEDRSGAEQALLTGKSPDSVKIALRNQTSAVPWTAPLPEQDRRTRLEQEKLRLEKTIASLTRRLGEVEEELDRIEDNPG
ncbi:MAG: hypothetical protein LBP60_02210 [Spirochaetaceae bacterium]|nr:hypothetical protein [Spirochaetaceae bacterium]